MITILTLRYFFTRPESHQEGEAPNGYAEFLDEKMLEIVQLPEGNAEIQGEQNVEVYETVTGGLEDLTAGVDSSLNPQIDVSEARFVMC